MKRYENPETKIPARTIYELNHGELREAARLFLQNRGEKVEGSFYVSIRDDEESGDCVLCIVVENV